ncbi:unnamed protein product [Rotaria sordida]|uniref:Uncharacterized protein n=1 Tax=Rotaria sordida TaxID=392033 RepID=A0A815IUX1_9BILA|nr:unnamed protein product [Rotaria sordida]
MMNNYNLTYRIIDTLKRFESNDKDSQYCQTYLINDEKDKNKTKYILRLIDLENLTNLTEFIMLYAKIQDSELILLDQAQLTEEMMTLNDSSSNSLYIEEIKKRRYTKEFHLFIKSCVSTRFELRLNHNQYLLYNNMIKLLEIC